jgi:ribosomal protein L7/L12
MEPIFWMGYFWGMGTTVVLLVMAVVLWMQKGAQRIHRLEEMGLYPRPGEPITDHHFAGLLRAGNKILAVKLYRQKNRVGLREAKKAVDRMAEFLPPD